MVLSIGMNIDDITRPKIHRLPIHLNDAAAADNKNLMFLRMAVVGTFCTRLKGKDTHIKVGRPHTKKTKIFD